MNKLNKNPIKKENTPTLIVGRFNSGLARSYSLTPARLAQFRAQIHIQLLLPATKEKHPEDRFVLQCLEPHILHVRSRAYAGKK